LFFFLMLPLTLAGLPDPTNSSESQPTIFVTSKLTIVTADGRHRFWIEIAQSTTQR
jgi:hypothetical protein